jgi:hypothetical protein
VRVTSDYHWDFSFAVYGSVILNVISLDHLFKLMPEIFMPLLLGAFAVVLGMLVMGVAIARSTGWGQSAPCVVRCFIPIVCLFCYLLKTVLFIPLLNIVIVAVVPSIAQELKISNGGAVS